MAIAADLPQLQIYVDDRSLFEAVATARSAITGEPSSAAHDPGHDWGSASFRLAQDGRRGHRECLAVGWKVVPVGPSAASAADFEGGQLPSGTAIIPKDGPNSYEVYPKIRAVDDHATEPNEQFRIELTDVSGATIWGRGEPGRDHRSVLLNKSPKAAVFTIHDTERDCARAGEGSGFKLSVEARGDTYRLVIQQPEKLNQCAFVAWHYLDDTVPSDDHHDVDMALQGVAYFSSSESFAALGGYQQWFDLGIPVEPASTGQRVRIAWGSELRSPGNRDANLAQAARLLIWRGYDAGEAGAGALKLLVRIDIQRSQIMAAARWTKPEKWMVLRS